MGFFVVSALAATAMPIVSEKRTAEVIEVIERGGGAEDLLSEICLPMLQMFVRGQRSPWSIREVTTVDLTSAALFTNGASRWMEFGNPELTINGDSLNFSLEPDWPQITSDISPTPLVFTLTITDGVTTEIETWDNLVTVYPRPEITPRHGDPGLKRIRRI